MSAYAHQMERQYSVQSLSSRGGSEIGSHFVVESGFYMTSFAATIFIAALVTVGVLLITLLIALTIMLQSCQNSNKGVVEIQKTIDDYKYCRLFVQHAELNGLGIDDFPAACRNLAIHQIMEGQYKINLNVSLWMVERYFDSVVPSDDSRDVVLMDLDDILPLTSGNRHLVQRGFCSACFKEVKHLKQMLFLQLYTKLQASGWSLILFSQKPEQERNATIEQLTTAGYGGWLFIIMRSEEEMHMGSNGYFHRRREVLQKEGFRISCIISSQMDALTGPTLGERIFKLPNPAYYYLEDQCEHVYVPA
ncbi:hypothetical protein K2173_011494 [Erythroxylum novogranatense]|uniref:Acid phosphatase n=1 Tax=Erythroxylum novogranatense TaxID=1862640 RepID=A0AAV8TW53_9ROSI|nr:hypothetical protein K2173_011494 [Erythroxylum novogranatense]